MFELIFIVLIQVAGLDRVTSLEKYKDLATCMKEKLRIEIEMAKVYPDDPTWKLECRILAI